MGQANITWIQNQQFIGTDSTNHSIVISSPADGIGMKPSELLLLAVGSCTGYDVVNLLSKRRIELTELHIQVTSEQDQDPPWRFRKMHIHYQAAGVNLNERELEKAIKLSKEKYCSVSATLQGNVEITTDFEILETPCAEIAPDQELASA